MFILNIEQKDMKLILIQNESTSIDLLQLLAIIPNMTSTDLSIETSETSIELLIIYKTFDTNDFHSIIAPRWTLSQKPREFRVDLYLINQCSQMTLQIP